MVFFYKYGLFDASENDFIDDLIGVLVDSLVGTFGNAENKLAKIFINYQHACFLVPACTAALPLATHAACMASHPACCLRGSAMCARALH